MMYPQRKKIFYSLLIAATLAACSDSQDKKEPIITSSTVRGEVHLAPDSPKKAYIKTTILSLTQHPLLEPLTGKVTYNESATSRISSPVAGRVITTPITLGTQVQTGSTLLELDSPDVAAAEADYAKAQADLILAKKDFIRQKELYEGKAVSQKELERSQDDFNAALSEVRRAQDRLKNLHISAQQNDGRFALKSPITGTVVERNVNPGIEVRPDRDVPLYVISDTKKLTLIMAIFEVNLSKIRLGQKLSISVPAYPDKIFSATVQYIGQVLDEKTRSIQVRCDLPNNDGLLLPGMYATINVESDPNDLAIVIPLTAVFTEGEVDFAFIAIDENHYQQRPVEISLRLKDKAVISKGLNANEKLVSEGALTLRSEEEVETDSDKNNPN
ncbi:MAG: efflux RND transporter periplasmic adaptor subunit [Methylococcales bacterium]|nr:MAG: efflux RND transporter periplasmic adaptor subunit [Methylococcales bacterium]